MKSFFPPKNQTLESTPGLSTDRFTHLSQTRFFWTRNNTKETRVPNLTNPGKRVSAKIATRDKTGKVTMPSADCSKIAKKDTSTGTQVTHPLTPFGSFFAAGQKPGEGEITARVFFWLLKIPHSSKKPHCRFRACEKRRPVKYLRQDKRREMLKLIAGEDKWKATLV